ncbi:MoaD/ThiS family protein [Mycobacterium sherrisii]|uniref:Molybdopterin synthase sulfur carrier subunit n=1 Tax=Mycobacterium sherrisii TaxID=243061 RepID=A0A1E3T990_9MYCO|nr:MoaD/ThiS family protein [Mycobacterium sherrisii]MCV7031720.1 MoaD/ThiS family protein [Mycobacterium sherrisii]MEC4763700.1 MoaD/ThiS family protein [Mycobacterium sherrisii]ODR11049.1 molybdopterin synthase sulfur carrier subunit [Mycobacterium sherrisii]ORW86324.1 molybdopterin synthase sulfur carrier subunit [Mycobacterium sherrisii]
MEDLDGPEGPEGPDGFAVTVRYFAAARAAAGVETETVVLRPGTTVAELVQRLAGSGTRLATVLGRCSYLCDGIAVRDATKPLRAGNTIDVLPPFAGG